jgi:hypothetical protein
MVNVSRDTSKERSIAASSILLSSKGFWTDEGND